MLKFDDKFEVQDDFEVLKRMGLLLGEFQSYGNLLSEILTFLIPTGMDKGESTPEDIEKLKKMVPKSYQKYIESELKCFLNNVHKFKKIN